MSSVSDFLPKPKNVQERQEKEEYDVSDIDQEVSLRSADSSAGLVVKQSSSKRSNALSVPLDSNNQVDYSVIARQGHDSGRIVQTSYDDLVPLRMRANAGEVDIEKPSEEEAIATTAKTKAAIDRLLGGKLESTKPRAIPKKPGEATYVRYKARNQMGENSDVQHKERIIKIVDVAEDPLNPPKFKKTKVPRGPRSPPPPVMRSPPRKITAAEREDWYIPPAISNWKNPKGYAIALDKRLAGGSSNSQEVTINDNKAKLAEALYAAEQSAREEIKERAALQRKLAEKEQEAKEQRLRDLAKKAREEVSKPSMPSSGSNSIPVLSGLVAGYSDSEDGSDEEETLEERRRREAREEKRMQAEKELRMSRMGNERKVKLLAKEQNRDISEKVALGLAKPSRPSGEAQFDSRLFSQSNGLTARYNEDQVYDKGLFAAQEAVQNIYRPRTGRVGVDAEDDEMDRIKSESRFEGLGSKGDTSEAREGPVEFERESDPFGLDQMGTSDQKQYGLQSNDENSRKRKHGE